MVLYIVPLEHPTIKDKKVAKNVLDRVRKSQEAIEQGKTLTSEELKQDIDSW